MLTLVSRVECANDGSTRGPLDILLVDDEPTVGTVTAEGLRQRGHRVVLAATIAKARADLTDKSFDVILLDLQVADERGEDLILSLRASGYPMPSVVIVSARPTLLIQTAVNEIGAAAYVQKPCVVGEIEAVMHRVLCESIAHQPSIDQDA
jgi:DNA-binding response OmpR family regulator